MTDQGRAGDTPRERYRADEARYADETAALSQRIARLEAGRLATFVVGAVLGLLRGDLGVPVVFPTVASVAFFVAFVVLVARHRRARHRLRRADAARTLARAGLLRLERDFGGLEETLDAFGYRDPLLLASAADDPDHPYVLDLDLFGPASVRALLGPTPSVRGSAILRSWLSAPAAPEEIARRQGAVRALAADPARPALAIEGLLVERVGRSEWEAFCAWLDRPAFFSDGGPAGPDDVGVLPRWSVPVSGMLSTITLGLFVAWSVADVPLVSWAIPLGVQVALAARWGRRLSAYFEPASAKSPGLRRHHPVFAAWEEHPTEEPALRTLRARLRGETGASASQEVKRFERLMDWADGRASLLHVGLAAFFLWDVHLAAAVERWRARVATHVQDWFEALGELEALSALATLAHDQPDWCFPEVSLGEAGLAADQLGHPLLSDDVRRSSDVRLEPPGRFLLVTGSNMSGKSTLLRSIGLAAVLGQAGSVVCAQRATMTPLRVFTSMRIHDSLVAGVSLFMAELLRLKALVDAADADDPRALLYLVDEVLQGTNSEERRVAARRIITHLLGSNAIGAVTTHDLALHEDRALDPASTKVHFRETVGEEGDEVLTFDYLLRPGLATSRNALKLLKIVGLDDGD